MGDSDRLKKHISDYIEHNLDPATRKVFEQQLKQDPKLEKITDDVSRLPVLLKNLTNHKTSEDFNLRLREKIHGQAEKRKVRLDLKRVSYAFSLVVFIAAIIITVTNLQEQPENPEIPTLQTVTPALSTPPVPRSSLTSDEMNVKTKEEQTGIKDSLESTKKPTFKYVDQEK